MFKKQNQRKLDPRVKYQQRQFKGKLAKARGYQRPATGSLAATLRKFNWKLALGVVIALGIAWYISFIPNFLFIRTVAVQGARGEVVAEVRVQVERYLENKYFVFPKKNLLFTSRRDLTSYLATANAHIWKVEKISKKWPHGLEITITPREPAFLWMRNGEQVLVANDGSVLPPNELKDTTSLLPLSGQFPVNTAVGSTVFEGKLLSSLTMLRDDFPKLTGLQKILSVELVPVLAESFAINPTAQQISNTAALSGAGKDAAATTTVPVQPLPRTSTVLDVPPRELKLRVAADASKAMPEFSILVDVDDATSDTLTRLKELLAGQSADRLSHLAYVDMRFDSRVYICLTTAPCAQSTTVGADK